MNRITIIIAIGMVLILSAAPAIAGNVGKRQINQQKRIHQGIRSGELTRGETGRLQRQQRNIQRTKRQAHSDGVVTPRERVRIQLKQNRASRHIFRQKHDRQTR